MLLFDHGNDHHCDCEYGNVPNPEPETPGKGILDTWHVLVH